MRVLILVLLGITLWPLVGDAANTTGTEEATMETTYNDELATRLEADDYGMRTYVVAFLKAGPSRSQNEEEAAALQRAHLDNIERLSNEGKLILAGPFLDGGDVRGIYIFDVANVDEARRLTDSDPAIKAGRLTMELHPWYGSAALMQVQEIHRTIAKKDP